MNKTQFNIWKFLRLLVVIVPIMFVLPSCSKDGANATPPGVTDEQLAQEHRGCWQDKILTSLYETMGSLAMRLYGDITKGALAVEMVGFALWFVFRLIRFVSSVTQENSGEVWNEVFKKIMLCLFCGLLASSNTMLLWTLNTLIFPIYNAFLELGGAILNSAAGQETVSSMRVMGDEIEITKPALCLPGAGALEATVDGFPEAPMHMMNCMICSLNERLSLGNTIAFKVMRAPGFWLTINGLILLVTFMIIKLSFVFYLVDNIFKFAVMVIMLPILILTFPFMNKWAIYGFKTILTSAAFMMAISIMIAMTLMAIVQIILQNPTVFDPKDAKNSLMDFSAPMLALLLVAFLVVGTVKVAKEVTSALVDAKVDNKFQEKLLGIALIVAGWITGGVSSVVAKTAMAEKWRKVYNKSWAGKAMKKRSDIIAKVNKFAGR